MSHPASSRAVTLAAAVTTAVATAAGVSSAFADEPLPVIVTYELSKARSEAQAEHLDPKQAWVGRIVARIEDRKPMLDLKLKQPASVAVAFVVGHDGHLVSTSIARSSGDPGLDRRAVAVLVAAAPFPPMPPGLTDDSLAFTVPLRFK